MSKLPLKDLKGFARVDLKPSETRYVTLTLDRRAFSYYVNKKDWAADFGKFEVMVGGSSDKIQVLAPLHFNNEQLRKSQM